MDDAVSPPTPPTLPEPLTPSLEAVLRVVRELYVELHRTEPPDRALQAAGRLDEDLGFDSLARIELLLRLEQRFGRRPPEAVLGAAGTVGELLEAFRELPSGGLTVGGVPIRGSSLPSGPDAAPPEAASTRRGGALGAPQEAETLPEVLAWQVERRGDLPHLILLGPTRQVLTYRALSGTAERVAAGLCHLGIGPGETVALMLPTGLDFFFALFGTLLAGAIPVPIYPPAHAAQLEEHVQRHARILHNAGAVLLISDPEVAVAARLLQIRVASVRRVCIVTELLQSASAPMRGGAGTPWVPRRAGGGEAIALLQYTSGSTGDPKGVVLTHRQLLANIRTMGRRIGACETDVFVSWLPLYHDMGLIGAWLGSLYYGVLLVLMPPTSFLLRPAAWLRAIHDYRATLSAAPNFGYELCARRASEQDLSGLDLSSWRVAFNGAEPVLADTLEHFAARFAPHGFRADALAPVYGLAEAAVGLTFPPKGRGPRVDRVDGAELMRHGRAVPAAAAAAAAAAADGLIRRVVSCGVPLPGYQVRIVDADERELPERVEGSLQFQGPSATAGYYRNAEATARLCSGPWRNSGDLAYMADGEVFLTGRAKDLIIRRGRHVHPQEVEQAAAAVTGVRRGCVAAFGVGDRRTATERLVLVAETHERDAGRCGELRAAITAQVAHCIGEPPDEVLLAPPHSVLKTSSGKLRRAATRAAYLAGTLGRVQGRPFLQLWRLGLHSLRPLLRRSGARLLRLGYGCYAWVALLVIGIPAALLSVVRVTLRRPASWNVARRTAAAIVRAWSIPLSFSAPPDPGWREPHIVVINHCSYTDSLLLVARLPTRHRFIAKRELRGQPLLGAYLEALGTLFVERNGNGHGIGSGHGAGDVHSFVRALAQGDSLAVFPEGTFTRAAGLRDFHLGAFEAAVRASVPVIPIALRGSRSVLRDGQWLPNRAPVRIHVGSPIRPPGSVAPTEVFSAAVRLRDAARAQILEHCGEPDLA